MRTLCVVLLLTLAACEQTGYAHRGPYNAIVCELGTSTQVIPFKGQYDIRRGYKAYHPTRVYADGVEHKFPAGTHCHPTNLRNIGSAP